MRFLKMAAYAVGALVALVVVAIVLVVIFVDPNDYRDEIAARVESATGRKLTLDGNLKLAFFPWLALETGPAALGERQGFGDEPFVSIDSAHLSVRLLPLLRGRLEVGTVKLEGARIRLVTDAQGRDNWADLAQRKDAPDAAAQPSTQLPTIAGLSIVDAAVTMENRQTHARRVIRDFNLDTGRLASGQPFELTTGFVFDQDASLSIKMHLATTVTADLERNIHRLADPEIAVTVLGQGYPPEGIPVQIRAQSLSADIGRKALQLDGLSVVADWKGDGFPDTGVPLKASAPTLKADLAQQTLEIDDLNLDAAGAQLSGSLKGQEILDAPRITGGLRLAPVSPREWLPRLGVTLPVTSDADVLKQLSFASNVTLTSTSAELSDVKLKLDDTSATGSLGIASFENRALRFDLDIDRIDADRYLPPPDPEAQKQAAKADRKPPTEIPIETLRTLNARGEVRVGEAIFAGLKFTRLRLGVTARDGQVRLNPTDADMYGGTFRGDIGIDARGDSAHVNLDERISGVDFSPLLKDLTGKPQRFSGKGSANARLTGSGRNSDEVMQTLDGNVDFAVADGALEGVDLWYEIRRARAVLRQQTIPERTGAARTPFDSMKGSGAMKQGVLNNNDLNIASQYLRVAGQGTLDLPKNALNYQLTATVLRIPPEGSDPAQMQDMVNASIPIRITGSLDDPKVRPDVEGYVKDRAKQELKKQEDKLKDKLGDKLKDLLGR